MGLISIVASGNSDSRRSIASSRVISPEDIVSGSFSLSSSSSGWNEESKGSVGGLDNCISIILSLNFSVPYFIPYQTALAATARGRANITHSTELSGDEIDLPDNKAGAIIVAKRVPIPATNKPK